MDGIPCEDCESWCHRHCVKFSCKEFLQLSSPSALWTGPYCTKIASLQKEDKAANFPYLRSSLVTNSVSIETLKLYIQKLSLELQQINDICAVTVQTSVELEQKLAINKSEIGQSCVVAFSRLNSVVRANFPKSHVQDTMKRRVLIIA